MSAVWLPLVEDGRKILTTQCSADSRRARDSRKGRQGPSLNSNSRLLWSPWEWGP